MPELDYDGHLENVINGLDENELKSRLINSMKLLVQYGGIDGDHHKRWCIDQVIRISMGCPEETVEKKDCNGNPYTFEKLVDGPEYKELVRLYCNVDENGEPFEDEDGNELDYWDWDCGIAP